MGVDRCSKGETNSVEAFDVDGEGEKARVPVLEGCFTCNPCEDVGDEGVLALGISAPGELYGSSSRVSGSVVPTVGSTLSLKPVDKDVWRCWSSSSAAWIVDSKGSDGVGVVLSAVGLLVDL